MIKSVHEVGVGRVYDVRRRNNWMLVLAEREVDRVVWYTSPSTHRAIEAMSKRD